jgi:hypothetical protein
MHKIIEGKVATYGKDPFYETQKSWKRVEINGA